MTTSPSTPTIRQLATKELALLTVLLFLGLAVMPLVIYNVGQAVFGTYGGLGYSDFFGTLSTKVRTGDIVAWFLILSPYLGWQCLRLMIFGWRKSGTEKQKP
ncbi:MAG: hypothetical protein OEW73_04550 [Gammaproteobacteria bacterium]|nr:hypothetical protein [Gammaproteobacteria bacterium]MDH5240031.1 hypothetical protein [Gammaproteobacteria bacterium]MDH5261133.1 hypothetical protein [Gammaproteobacteria bacterium]MDH5584953.1 hypothetical protein [Gammaproteobacteria bacterium]